jgi:hypothetical protein
VVVTICHTSYVEIKNRRIVVQANLGIKHGPISKITNAKSAGDMTQVVECLPGNYKALSSNPRTAKKNFF